MSATRLADLLRSGTAALARAGIDGAATDARHLMAHATGIPRDRLTLHADDFVPDGMEPAFAAALAARIARMPVSRIVGTRTFYGRDFRVTADVLDPRPETEFLVALAGRSGLRRVVDLGTGSGCVLVSILAECPAATGIGTDISGAALDIAAENARRNGVADRAEWCISDWFAGIEGRFDLVVSNPPYIAAAELPTLSPEVRDHDPPAALSPGGDGLTAYRAIASRAAEFLMPGGRLLLEIGPTQGKAVASLVQAGGFSSVATHRDLDGRDRVVSGVITR